MASIFTKATNSYDYLILNIFVNENSDRTYVFEPFEGEARVAALTAPESPFITLRTVDHLLNTESRRHRRLHGRHRLHRLHHAERPEGGTRKYRNTLKQGALTGCTCTKMCAPDSQMVHDESRVDFCDQWLF